MKILNILVRRCLPLEDFDDAVRFHESLIGQKARLAFDYPQYNLKLAQVASILFIGGTPETLERFKKTNATFLVDDVRAYENELPKLGAKIVSPVKEVPTGWNMLVCHPDGALIEYVEHKVKNPADRLPT